MPAELAPPLFFDVVVELVVFLCRTVPPVEDLGDTALPGLRAAPTVVELAGAGIFLSYTCQFSL
jgi:hypothetical protein